MGLEGGSHPMLIIDTAVPGLAQESVHLVQKHLKLTADQTHLFLFITTFPAQLTLRHVWANLTA